MDKVTIKQIPKEEFISNEKFYKTLTDLIIENWGDPGTSFLKRSLADADVVFVAKQNEKIIAFVSGDYIDHDILLLHWTVVSKEYKGHGLYRKLNDKIIFDYIKKHKIQAIRGFYLAFRTANPSLYERVYKYLPLYPDFKNNRIPNKQEIRVFHRLCQLTAPQSDTDPQDFIIKHAYVDSPGLIIKPENIPFALNKDVNNFFEEKLALSKQQGNVMVCMGKVNIFAVNKYVKKNG